MYKIDLEQDEKFVKKLFFQNGSVNTIVVEEINENDVDFDILQLKNNVLPTGLVPLEDFFYFNNVAKKLKN